MTVLSGVLPLHVDPTEPTPPLAGWQFLVGWTWDWSIGLALVAMLGLYLWGVARLKSRGDAWPPGRTLAWCLGGVGTIAIATLSVLGRYDTVLFSVHMVQHILLNMMAPVMLALGAPVTLLLRNLGGPGRRRIVAILHSWPAKILTFPPLATAVMIANPYVLYLSNLYPATLANPVLHDLVHAHFLITGCLYFWPLLGVDPMPIRIPYPFRVLLIMITLPFHAFLGVTIMGQRNLIAEDWYLSFNRAWPPSPLEDQYLAGAIMWGAGDIAMAIIMGVFFVQWFRASRAEARREDRRLDREERLAALAAERAAAAASEAVPGAAGTTSRHERTGYDAAEMTGEAGDQE